VVHTPDVRRLTPQKALVFPTIEVLQKEDFGRIVEIGNFERVAVTIDGLLGIATPGDYTVCITSDDGAHIFVDGMEIAGIPGLHGPITGCGTRFLSRGDHGVWATFFQNRGGAYLKITYKGPDTKGADVLMPSVGFDGECAADIPQCPPGSGWCARFYFDPNGDTQLLDMPDVDAFTPQTAKTTLTIDFNNNDQLINFINRPGSFDRVAAVFSGELHVNKAGEYTACVTSDDGSSLLIDGGLVASAPGLHGPLKRCGTQMLDAGDHDVRVEFFQNGGGAAIRVTYAGPDTNGQEVLMPSMGHDDGDDDDDDNDGDDDDQNKDSSAVAVARGKMLRKLNKGRVCSSLKGAACKKNSACVYSAACGCIPITCECSDSQCIKKGGKLLISPTATAKASDFLPKNKKGTGEEGWCSKWYYNPLGGADVARMPDIQRLSPQKALVVQTVELVRNEDFAKLLGTADFFRVAMTLEGTLSIKQEGEYTVCVTSDDGSHVYIDGMEIAAKPGLHGPLTDCGSRYLSAGDHPAMATFYQNGGGSYLKISYKGPDTDGTEVLLPSTGFEGTCEAPVVKCECGSGWCGLFYYNPNGNGDIVNFPDVSKLVPQVAITMISINLPTAQAIGALLGKSGNFDRVAAEFRGVLYVNLAGSYRVCTNSDDGSRVLVNGQSVAAAPGLHGPLKNCGNVNLARGEHNVKVEYFQNGGGAALWVTYAGPDTGGAEVFMPAASHPCNTDKDPSLVPASGKPKPISAGVNVYSAATMELATVNGPAKGWCSKWYYNPLGGAGIGSFPNLARLNPQRAIVLNQIELVRDADFSAVTGVRHFDLVAMTIDGTLTIQREGQYTLCVTSDDGSHVYVDGLEMAARPGLHPPETGCGTRFLAPGDHSVYATFFENGGGAYLKITYRGPDTNNREVLMPSTMDGSDCNAPIVACKCGQGWCGRFYYDPSGLDEIRNYPDVTKLVPQSAVQTMSIDFMSDASLSALLSKNGNFDRVAVEFVGSLHVNQAGEYTVCTLSDDGSHVYVDGAQVAAAPGLHPPVRNCGTVPLSAGGHDVKVEFFENGGGAAIKVTYSGPDTKGQEVLMPSASHQCEAKFAPADRKAIARTAAGDSAANAGTMCAAMRRRACKVQEANRVCRYTNQCGCIPHACDCGDGQCIKNGGKAGNAVATVTATTAPSDEDDDVPSGKAGWCSRWYYNPLGGAGIGHMPDLRRINPQKALVIKTVNFLRDDDFTAVVGMGNFDRVAMTLDGTWDVTEPGEYTLCVTSDDGSHVYVDGMEMAARPGLHPPETGCGKRFLSAGEHSVYATFFENGGGAYLKITYKGPDTQFKEQLLPSKGYGDECAVPDVMCSCGAGWCGKFYYDPNGNNEVRDFPDYSDLTPQRATTTMMVNFANDGQISAMLSKIGNFDRVAARFLGVLHINRPGEYTMCLNSDDGSRLYVGDRQVVDNGGLHAPVKVCGKIKLDPGDVDITVDFFENGGGAALIVTYLGPDTNNAEVLMPSTRHECKKATDDEGGENVRDADGDASLCAGMEKDVCEQNDETCAYYSDCGCIPRDCSSCEDQECIDNAGKSDNDDDDDDDKTELPRPAAYTGKRPQGWSFLPNDRLRLNGAPTDWATAFRRDSVDVRKVRIRIRAQQSYVRGAIAGVAFLATDADNLEAIVFRRAVRGRYAYAYHLVRLDGEEKWSKGVKVYLPKTRAFFEVTVNLFKRTVRVNRNRIGLNLGFPQASGELIGVIGRGRTWVWEWMRVKEQIPNPFSVKSLPVGSIVSLASLHQYSAYLRGRGESTGILFVNVVSADVTTVEPNPSIAVSLAVGGLSYRTSSVTGTRKPEWGETWDVPLPCRSDGDKVAVALFDGDKKLGESSFLVRAVDGVLRELTINVQAAGVGGQIRLKARFDCMYMGVEASQIAPTDTTRMREASFRVMPGLSNSAMISFQSVAFPGFYLARDTGYLKLARLPGRSTIESGFVLEFLKIRDKKLAARALAGDLAAIETLGTGTRTLVPGLDFPAPEGLAMYMADGVADDDGSVSSAPVTIVGVVRGIVDAKEAGKFTVTVSRGEALVFIDGVKVTKPGEVTLVQGLHDIMMVAGVSDQGKGLQVVWEGPKQGLEPISGYHTASLPSAGSMEGFLRAATFDPVEGEAGTPGAVKLQSVNKDDGSIRVKGSGARNVWVCSRLGYMKQSRRGMRTRIYFLKTTQDTQTMPKWQFLQPNARGFAPELAFSTGDAIERSINARKCRDVLPPALDVPQIDDGKGNRDNGNSKGGNGNGNGNGKDVAPAAAAAAPATSAPNVGATCMTMRRTECKQNPSVCRHTTGCGCIPLTCDCGEMTCIKAGGKAFMPKPGAKMAPVTSLHATNSLATSMMLASRNSRGRQRLEVPTSIVLNGPRGWCSRWYFNPLGGAPVNSMPELHRLVPQRALVIPSVRFVRDGDFTAVVGVANFDRVAMSVDGVLEIKTEGVYTVCVTSDDGSHVYMDGREIAARPGLHPPETGCGSRFLSAGRHSVMATFFENGGGAYFAITYKGPDTNGQEVVMPSSGFLGECKVPEVTCPCGSGWCARFFFDPFGPEEVRDFPDFTKLSPQFARTIMTINMNDEGSIAAVIDHPGNLDRIAAEFRGVLRINRAGSYTVCTTSDDGSRVFVNRQLVADAPGLHPPLRRCGTTTLAAGDHDVKVDFFENGGGSAIRVTYSGPDTNNQEILMPSGDHPCVEPAPSTAVALTPSKISSTCAGLSRTQCTENKNICMFRDQCGCIPKGCSCGDTQCIRNGPSTAVALQDDGPTKNVKSDGWCSRWYYNPLGGAGMGNFPDLKRVKPQLGIPLKTVEFVRDDDFTRTSGIKHFDLVAMTLDGTLTIQREGQYTVCVTSDDGSHVYVDGWELAARPGLHPPETGCGTRFLTAGDHSLYATFFENGGGAYLKITYRGPDTNNREVLMPSTGYEGQCVAEDMKCSCGVGWCGRFYYEPNGSDQILDFPRLGNSVAQRAKTLLNIDFMSDAAIAGFLGKVGNFDRVAAQFTGVLHIDSPGEYTICTLSDDGSQVLIDDVVIAAAPGLHPPLKQCGQTRLLPGDHNVLVEFFENGGGSAIRVTYSGPDTNNQELLMPSATHSCPAPPKPAPGGCVGGVELPSTHVGMVATGIVEASTSGTYTFRISGSGMARLWVDGELATDKKSADQSAEGEIALESGVHSLRLSWFQGPNALQSVFVEWMQPGSDKFTYVQGRRYTSTHTQTWRTERSYEYRVRAAQQAASFLFRRGLFTPSGLAIAGDLPRADSDTVNLITRGPDAVGDACGAYLMAPGTDESGRRKLLAQCKQEDDARRNNNMCGFVDEHGFCYREAIQQLCKAHSTQVRCMTSVPSPEYASCVCTDGSCRCPGALPDKDRATVLTPLPLESIVDVLDRESRDAWVHFNPQRMLVARCRAVVRVAYVELVWRPADFAGLVKLTKACLNAYPDGNAGSVVRKTIKEGLPELSPYGVDEYEKWHTQREKAVQAFEDVLLREPNDSFELHKYAVKFQQGASEENVAAELGFSDEFDQIRRDAATRRKRAEKLARLIYIQTLMRPPSMDEFTRTVDLLMDNKKASEIKKDLLQGEECSRWCKVRYLWVCVCFPVSFFAHLFVHATSGLMCACLFLCVYMLTCTCIMCLAWHTGSYPPEQSTARVDNYSISGPKSPTAHNQDHA
jgi:hypothetical protein